MWLRDYIRTSRYLLPLLMFGLVVCAIAGLWLLLGIFQPLPPRTVTMATGPAGGAYQEYGERYREVLAREGFNLRLLPTNGALDNLHKLKNQASGVSVGFIQGGIVSGSPAPSLKSLGTVFCEPLWFFCRDSYRNKGLNGLKGRRIAVGPEGSGTRAVVMQLLARNGITPEVTELLALPFEEGSQKLLNGEIEALFILASWQSPVVRRLLVADHIDLLSFPHTDAYVALYPFLNKITVPSGVGDMLQDRPPADTAVLAAKASLVVRSDVHPAIQFLLLEAAGEIHSGAGIFQKAGQFPASESVELPLSDEAQRFYRFGEPFLQRVLPFWMAVFLGRLFIILLPTLGLLYPLLRFAPVLYAWKMRQRLFRFYKELRAVESALVSAPAGGDPSGLVARLDQLENKVDSLWLPTSVMDHLYIFKEHIKLVRERLVVAQRETS